MTKSAVKKIGWILRQMHSEAARRHAPVFAAEESTKETPFKILVFTMLSARTRDETTMKAVARLFGKAKTPKQIIALGPRKLEELLYGVGFYRTKARHLLAACRIIESHGHVPDTLEELLKLPGVGRKTANIVLARAFGKTTLGVDVHVHRISNRLGLVKTKKPEQTELALVKIVQKKHIRSLNLNFVAFGQTVCLPRKPMCGICPLNRICLRIRVKEHCPCCRFGLK
ncbi:MAG: endonuclease III [Candidatus Micrarchaeota archaeon]